MSGAEPSAGVARSLAVERPGIEAFPEGALSGSIGDRLAAVASSRPDAEALNAPAGVWTHGQLLAEVDALAGGIQQLVDPEHPAPVAVIAAHDAPLVIAVLAVVRAGHIVVVLDPAVPDADRQAVVDACSPALVLHDDAYAEAATSLGCELRRIGTLEGPLREVRLGASSPAMLAFTSGTSDRPKGAVITHGLIMNLVRGATDVLAIGPDDRIPMLFPLSLAVAAYPMFLPLLNGAALCTLDVRSRGLEPVGPFLEEQRITLAYLAPTVVRFLDGALGDRSFPSLRLVALGGEQVDGEVVELANRLFSPQHLANGYGTTETGVVALHVLDPAGPVSGVVPCGRPVEDVEIVILDDRGSPLPQGTPGEVAIVSPFVMAGYWEHPEATRSVLSEDPRGRPEWQLYRTGDHGTVRSDGSLVVHGRVDTRVKVRGQPVVLGEVESDLRAMDALSDAAVVAETRGGVTELVAFVVPAEGAPLDPPGLRAELLERRPSFRVPSRWVVVDELPQLPNGKLDRRALRDLDEVAATAVVAGDLGAAAVDGRGELRDVLRDIWRELLPVGLVGDDEDFFHLGGDSLLAAQMLIEVERRLGVTVPMGELVHARTVRGLAEVVQRLRASGGTATLAGCVQLGDEAVRPRLWFVPDLQGSAFRVRHLAQAVGDDQPVWSLESPLMDGSPNPFTELQTFSARLLTDLRRAQPEGPYWLAGYSFGGICAYEMARQLVRDGATVAFLGVVDVGPGYRGAGWSSWRSPGRPWFGVAKPPPVGSGPLEVASHYRQMAAGGPAVLLRHLSVLSGAARVVDPMRFRADLRRNGRVRPEWRLWYAWEEHWKLAARHWDRASSYSGPLDLFWEETTASADATMGWGGLVPEVRVHRFGIGGGDDHRAILEPAGAAALGPVLRRVLDDQLASRSGRPDAAG